MSIFDNPSSIQLSLQDETLEVLHNPTLIEVTEDEALRDIDEDDFYGDEV